jgi:uncharacterized Zn-finger protein
MPQQIRIQDSSSSPRAFCPYVLRFTFDQLFGSRPSFTLLLLQATRFLTFCHLCTSLSADSDKSNDFKCSDCNREFRTEEQLERHTQQAHTGSGSDKGDGTEIKCDICGVAFSQRSNLRRHIDSVHNGCRFPCTACPSTFGQAFDLHRHVERCAANGDAAHAAAVRM